MRWLSVLTVFFSIGAGAEVDLSKIKLAEGFKIELFAQGVKNARSLARGDDGVIYVGTRSEGKVYALVDTNGDFVVDSKHTLLEGKKMPNGVAYRNGDLFVAEVHQVLQIKGIHRSNLDQRLNVQVLFSNLPRESHHGWKYIEFGPDGKLYLPVGAPCNVCLKSEKIYASIQRLDLATNQLEAVAHGVRNTVGFDWHPVTQELWFSDNGRDMMGDDVPPDEINRVSAVGQHFGFPYLHGKDVLDPEFGGQRPEGLKVEPPVYENGAHVANLGIHFYRGRMFPSKYLHALFIAEHGSWNRTDPSGYQIRVLFLNGSRVESSIVFASGWLNQGKVWGRPVAFLELPDGSLLISDDHADVIYRVTSTLP